MKNYFITGTDTGVGKTHVTALLLAELRRRGIRAAAMKPIACGRDGRHDAEQYGALMNHEQPLDVMNPVYLRHPLAPIVAAKLECRRIDLRQIHSAFRLLSSVYRPVLVEGAGGLLVPIKRDYFVGDLARDLKLPVIIVARLGLGTINHTLLTVRQAQAMGLQVAGIVLNDTTGHRGLAERTNIKVIPELTGVPLLGVVPHGGGRIAVAQIARRLLRKGAGR
jgi:dethiobiotin synthetase